MADPIRLSQTSLNWEMQPGVRRMSQAIELTNHGSEGSLFKIKGTSQSRFIVRPASGLIKPGQRVKITFMVNLANDVQSTKPIHDQFMLYTLVAPPDAENKEGLDEYIKLHAKECHEMKIQSNIQFIKAPEETEAGAERRNPATNPDFLEGTSPEDKLFQSMGGDLLAASKGISVEGSQRLPADEEISEIKGLGKGPSELFKGPGMREVSMPPLNATEGPTTSQVEKTQTGHPKDESEAIWKLKEANTRLKADLKFAGVS